MSGILKTVSIPNFGELTQAVLRGIGVKRLTLEITPEVERILGGMPEFDIEIYITNRIKEHISAHIFSVLMQLNNNKIITVSTTSVMQDVKNGQDVRIRGLYGNSELVYADMTGNPMSYEKKKYSAISGNENKIFIYVPHHLTEYCYRGLQRNDVTDNTKDAIKILLEEYRKRMKKNETIEIRTYDLREGPIEKTYLFTR